jgi:hypothetical protein
MNIGMDHGMDHAQSQHDAHAPTHVSETDYGDSYTCTRPSTLTNLRHGSYPLLCPLVLRMPCLECTRCDRLVWSCTQTAERRGAVTRRTFVLPCSSRSTFSGFKSR